MIGLFSWWADGSEIGGLPREVVWAYVYLQERYPPSTQMRTKPCARFVRILTNRIATGFCTVGAHGRGRLDHQNECWNYVDFAH